MQCEVGVLARKFNELNPPKRIDIVEPYIVIREVRGSRPATASWCPAAAAGACAERGGRGGWGR
jgi:hypothetical protein